MPRLGSAKKVKLMTPDKKTAPLAELSEAEIDAVGGGQTVVDHLAAVLAQVATSVPELATANTVFTQIVSNLKINLNGQESGGFTQRTSAQSVYIK